MIFYFGAPGVFVFSSDASAQQVEHARWRSPRQKKKQKRQGHQNKKQSEKSKRTKQKICSPTHLVIFILLKPRMSNLGASGNR